MRPYGTITCDSPPWPQTCPVYLPEGPQPRPSRMIDRLSSSSLPQIAFFSSSTTCLMTSLCSSTASRIAFRCSSTSSRAAFRIYSSMMFPTSVSMSVFTASLYSPVALLLSLGWAVLMSIVAPLFGVRAERN